jgi:hypothetical protein
LKDLLLYMWTLLLKSTSLGRDNRASIFIGTSRGAVTSQASDPLIFGN